MTEQLKHHRVRYNGKTVSMNYVSDPKREFALACMRVQDNGAPEGYVLTPKGEVFHVTQSKRMARKLTGEELSRALAMFTEEAQCTY